MSNIAVSTLAMKAAMTGIRNLGENQASGTGEQYLSWPSRRTQIDAGSARVAHREQMPSPAKRLVALVSAPLV